MRGDTQAASAAYSPTRSRRGWKSWVSQLRQSKRRKQVERLEVSHRLASEKREARRRGHGGVDPYVRARWPR
jgi:hypothetical protein